MKMGRKRVAKATRTAKKYKTNPRAVHDKMGRSEGEATQTIEVKQSITLEDVSKELSEHKRDALEVEI